MDTRLPKVIHIPTFEDERGSLTVMEKEPFEVKRAFWIHDATRTRGEHSHEEGEQLIIAVSGQFRLIAAMERVSFEWVLNKPTQGVLIPPGVWVSLDEFSEDAVALVLCSTYYSENDLC
jgi:dTDP-4-dehydrorhamnose 3,5-epimerase-like enzyme